MLSKEGFVDGDTVAVATASDFGTLFAIEIHNWRPELRFIIFMKWRRTKQTIAGTVYGRHPP